jgi:hypothetical protein
MAFPHRTGIEAWSVTGGTKARQTVRGPMVIGAAT